MLAIVIPYYKSRFFKSTLDSLVNQTDKRFKVYIGNDASPEDPEQILKTFDGKLNFEYQKFRKNLGSISLTKQWKRCIGMVEDESWLMILGDDDYLADNVVSSFYKHFDCIKNKTQVVRFASRIDRYDMGIFSITYTHPKWEKASTGFYRKYKHETMSSLSEYVFSKSSYKRYGFCDFPLAWYADDMAWLEFTGEQPIYSINDAVVYFRYSNNNISGKTDNLKLKEKAEYLFYNKLVNEKLHLFSKKQKNDLLLNFGEVCKKQNKLDFKNSLFVFKKLVAQGALVSALKFGRRFYRAKKKSHAN
ncbi:glycosyltransferase [Tamlana crocina]|uniref:Glycosyltransferase family 2 protein n=1 Tax=Tamlana crocina TaxID=393006 RepID=A0ABX1DBK2_9FLAO|nr:glycosyltransferase [Tamlana crocina]NJX15034.1 glycosyltransferase family 2 protein [Tamlana crocina]